MAIAFGLGSMFLVGLGLLASQSEDRASREAVPLPPAAENFFDGVDGVPRSAVAPMPPEARTASTRGDGSPPAAITQAAAVPDERRRTSGTGYVYRDTLRPALSD